MNDAGAVPVGAGVAQRGTVRRLLLGVAAPLAAVLAAMFASIALGHEPVHVNELAHAAVEMFGASVAFMLWLLLMLRQVGQPWTNDRLWTALAFLAMGIFDGFHAATHFAESPNRFVLLHSLAVFAGGLLFAPVWLSRLRPGQRSVWLLSAVVAAIAVVIGIYAIASPVSESVMPQMVRDGVFTPQAILLNVGGGIGFVVAGAYFAWRGLDPKDWEARVLASLCFLFGAGGILFDFSDPWDVVWWGWHWVRAFAYAIALGYFALIYRQQTQALADAKQTLATILDASAEGICGLDAAGHAAFVNPAVERMTGYSAAELVGRSHHDALHHTRADGRPNPAGNCPVHATLRDRKPRHVADDIFWRKDGSSFPVEYRVAAATGGGESLSAVLNFQDITARKRAEDAVKQLNQDLEDRASVLETANKELEGFAYSVSHDLRAPLRAVDGFARMFVEDHATGLDAEGQRQLGVIRENARKMGRLVDDLLAFSRMGRREMTLADIDMTALAADAADEQRRQESGRTIEIAIAPLPPVRGDPTMIRVVWTNLLSNAVKFTRPRTAARIEVGGRPDGDGNVYSVKDNGVGFNMEYAGKLFGMFQRLHGPEEFEGTGAGLALVQRIVHRHGGRIWAEGKVNEGAMFSLALPNKAA